MYKDNSNIDFNNSLVLLLLKAYVAKLSVEVNHVYYPNIFNFYMDLSITSCKIFEFIPGNLLVSGICKIQNRRENIERRPLILFC